MSVVIGNKQHQKGIALLTAIIITAMLVVASTSMYRQLQLSLRRTSNILLTDQGYLYTLGSEAWSRGLLIRDLKDDKNEYDGLDEGWAEKLPPKPVEGGEIEAATTDLQGRFNLNNLYLEKEADEKSKQEVELQLDMFKRLLILLELPESIAHTTKDWLDGDITESYPEGAEDLEYLSLDPPYRANNGLMAHRTELRLVKGIDAETFEILEPYVVALPEKTPINVNTADPKVLQSLAQGLNEAGVEQLISERDENPFKEKKSFLQRLRDLSVENKVKSKELESLISVDSQFYQLETVVRMQNNSQSLDSRLYSRLYKGEKDVIVISRTIGAY
jgi:general secretion pathway protein K